MFIFAPDAHVWEDLIRVASRELMIHDHPRMSDARDRLGVLLHQTPSLPLYKMT